MRISPLRRLAVSAAAAVTLTGGGLVALATPAAANHVGTIAVSQAGGQGAYVTLQVDLTYTGATGGGGLFSWSTGDGRSGSVSDGVANGTYQGDGSGSGTLSGGTGVLGSYTWTRTQPAANVARTRLTFAYPYQGAYTATWSGCCPDTTGSTPVSVQASLPACGNTLDDDGDGLVDLADPLCDDSEDLTEGPECPPFGPVVVCLGATDPVPGLPPVTVQPYDPSIVAGPTVAGYLDTYRFTVGGVGVSVPCVTLAQDAAETDACARAGGVRTNRVLLVAEQVPSATVTPGAVLAELRVCHAELVVTVLDFGVNSAPAYSLCEAGQVSL